MAYYDPPEQGQMPTQAAPAADSDAAYIAEVRASGQGKSEDYARFSDAELLAWKKYYQGGGKFKNDYGDIVDKPDERGANTPANMNGTGDKGDYGYGFNNTELGNPEVGPAGGGGGAYGFGGGAAGGGGWGGGVGDFVAPTWESAQSDPGYQAALKSGEEALGRNQAAKGVLRTGGSLKDLLDYNQGMAAGQYDATWKRAFEPWQTKFGAGENRWQTQYGGDLSKYLQKEGNIYDLLSQPPPTYGG